MPHQTPKKSARTFALVTFYHAYLNRLKRREQLVARLEGASQFSIRARSPKNIELYADNISIASLHPFRSLGGCKPVGIYYETSSAAQNAPPYVYPK